MNIEVKFIGVIPITTECGFGITIYSDGSKYYKHILDDEFLITSFEEVEHDPNNPIRTLGGALSGSEHKIGDEGILVWMNTKSNQMLSCPKYHMELCKSFMISVSSKDLQKEIEKYFE